MTVSPAAYSSCQGSGFKRLKILDLLITPTLSKKDSSCQPFKRNFHFLTQGLEGLLAQEFKKLAQSLLGE